MSAFSGWAFEWGGDFFSATWTIELTPHDASAQVTLADYWEMGDQSTAQVAFTKLTHRKSNGKDEVTHFISDFYNNDTADLTRIVGDSRLSSVTVGVGLADIYANWMLQIFNFD
jgi:hypothetical protein